MKTLALVCAFFLTGCVENTKPVVLSYDQLFEFVPSCENKEKELKQFKYIQSIKRFPQDPDDFTNDYDRSYNSRLKSIIWWYTYRCDQ